jgi:hypothetical protein
MANRSKPKTFIVPLCCAMGIVSALLHWIVPTRLLLGNPAEYAIAAVAAVLGVAAFGLFLFGFLLPNLRANRGLCSGQPFTMPAIVWSTLGLFVGAAATVSKLIRAIDYGFVPVQTEGAEWSFSVLTLINVPVLCCLCALYLLEQKQTNE